LGHCKQKQRGLRGLLYRWPSITEWEMYIVHHCSGPHLRNDLYCVKWDVKLYYTIPYTIAGWVTLVKGKGKVYHTPQESIGGCSSPSPRPWAHRWRTTNVCDTWPVHCQTYDYFPSRKASPPVGWYQIILLGDRGTCML